MTRRTGLGLGLLAVTVLFGALILTGGFTGAAIRASAAGGGDGCDPGRSPYPLNPHGFDGQYNDHSSVSEIGGDEADILNYSPWVDPENVNGVSAWTLLTSPGGIKAGYYAQVGWKEWPGGVRKTFTEEGLGSNFSINTFNPYPINSVHLYSTLWNPSTYLFSYYVDGVLLRNDFDYPGLAPTEAQIFGETKDNNDQMPGQLHLGETYTNMAILAPAAAPRTWYPFNLDGKAQIGDTNTMNYAQSPYPQPALDYMTTWDWACKN